MDGIATIFVHGSTASVTTIEYEPGLVKDIKDLGERLAPSLGTWQQIVVIDHDTRSRSRKIVVQVMGE